MAFRYEKLKAIPNRRLSPAAIGKAEKRFQHREAKSHKLPLAAQGQLPTISAGWGSDYIPRVWGYLPTTCHSTKPQIPTGLRPPTRTITLATCLLHQPCASSDWLFPQQRPRPPPSPFGRPPPSALPPWPISSPDAATPASLLPRLRLASFLGDTPTSALLPRPRPTSFLGAALASLLLPCRRPGFPLPSSPEQLIAVNYG